MANSIRRNNGFVRHLGMHLLLLENTRHRHQASLLSYQPINWWMYRLLSFGH
jgi:hypothetical protein